MEFSWLRRPTTAAADNVETGRLRFPDVPPTPHGDANASPADAPTLARRREELVWELNKSRIHQDMILRELVEMEHAMGFAAAGNNPVPRLPPSQDYWRSRTPSAPPLEESPPRSSTEHPSCGSRDPAAARVPPVYPHVEWPPAPSLQPRPASDTGKQQDWGSKARTHPFDGYVELRRSPNKPTLAEVSTAAASNAGTRPKLHEVRPGHKDERKAVVEDSHGVHPLYESGNQRNWQGKTEETIKVNQINGPMLQSGRHELAGQERASFDQQKGRDFAVLMPEQPRLGNGPEQQQECRSPGARLHMFDGHAELCLLPSKQALVEETLVPVAAKCSISPVRSALSFVKEAASRHQQAFAGEPKADVEDDHGLQPLGEIRNQINGQRKAVESAMEGPADKPTQPQPVGLQNVAYNEQKKVESNEADVEDGEISNQSNGQRRAVEPAMEGLADKPTQPQPTGLQNVAYNEQKKVESNESVHERATTGVKRKLDAEASPVKKQKPWPWCTICHVKMPTLHHLKEHLAGKLHWSNLTALQSSRNGAAEPNTTWSPPAWAVAATETNSLPRDGKENAVEGSMPQQGGKLHLKNFPHRKDPDTAKKADWKRAFYCNLCDVQCDGEKMLASHLGGRKHRERLEGSD